MPRKGLRYEIDDEWRKRVRDAMAAAQPPLKEADLARVLKCNRSVISDLFKKKATHSTYVVDINKAVGLPPPHRRDLNDDEFALILIYRALNESDRRRVHADAAARLSRTVTVESNPEVTARNTLIMQAADEAIESAEHHTERVSSVDERSPRSPRTRRASRGR